MDTLTMIALLVVSLIAVLFVVFRIQKKDKIEGVNIDKDIENLGENIDREMQDLEKKIEEFEL